MSNNISKQNIVEKSPEPKHVSRVTKLLEYDEIDDITLMKKKHHNYVIVKYDKKSTLPHQYYKVGYMRSIIVDTNTNEIVCIAPSKSIPLEELESECKKNDSSIHYEEFVDGVMINVFWDKEKQVWQYATRSNVGADIKYYIQNSTSKTFRVMFEEALKECAINLNVLPKDGCYTFVLQHPDNRIVTPVHKPRAVLVEGHFYGKAESDDDIIPLFPHGTKHLDIEFRKIIDQHSIPIPEKYVFSTIKEARDKYASRNTDFGCVGVVLKDLNQGWRSKIRNPVYEEVKQMRGNIPKLQYLYLVLRQSGGVKKYLEYFREHANEFKTYRDQLHKFTQTLYLNYVDCFIKKKADINSYPHQYKVCMKALHKIYLDTMMLEGRHVHKGVVINFFNRMPPQRQMYLLNYNYRK
jgi:hypothetical protein